MQVHRVAITGIGVASPNGVGKLAFWQSLARGISGVRSIQLFDCSSLPVTIAGYLPSLPTIQLPERLGNSHVARITRLAVAAACEALADSCLATDADQQTKQRTGVLVGTGGGMYEFLERQYLLYMAGRKRECSIYAAAIATAGTLSSDLSILFELRGPSHVISTGCTSSSDAIGYAFHLIRLGELECCLVGGADAPITPLAIEAFHALRVLARKWQHAPEKASRPFSADRDGFVLAEGAWFFVLENLDHAKARGAKIYAEVLGYASTCESFHRVRLSENPEETVRAIQLALQSARLPPQAIDYIHYHGTGTRLNDRIETRAIKAAFGEYAFQIPGSSVKSMIGHPQGASGAAALAATLFAMECDTLPPTINLEYPDADCDLDYVPQQARHKRVEYALVNCLGFGSKSSALVLRNGRSL